jgi:hypothetical protein
MFLTRREKRQQWMVISLVNQSLDVTAWKERAANGLAQPSPDHLYDIPASAPPLHLSKNFKMKAHKTQKT